jgi:hypothetical protein
MSGLFSLLKSILQSLTRRSGGLATPASPPASSPASSGKTPFTLAWGAKVSPEIRDLVVDICGGLSIEPDWLMACIAFESAYSFDPAKRNPGSSATGLIQFMSATARSLGTTTDALAAMTAVEQLDYVRTYFKPYAGRMHSLADVYMAILWPAAVGKPNDWPLFAAPSNAYAANKGLDANRDGRVTKAEAAAAVQAALDRGLQPGNVWSAA